MPDERVPANPVWLRVALSCVALWMISVLWVYVIQSRAARDIAVAAAVVGISAGVAHWRYRASSWPLRDNSKASVSIGLILWLFFSGRYAGFIPGMIGMLMVIGGGVYYYRSRRDASRPAGAAGVRPTAARHTAPADRWGGDSAEAAPPLAGQGSVLSGRQEQLQDSAGTDAIERKQASLSNAHETVKVLRRAAERGDVLAQSRLGSALAEGKGVRRDAREAVKWYRAAAEHGCAPAHHGLGAMYARGEGVPQDYFNAYIQLSLAVALGAEEAKPLRDEVARGLSADEIRTAQRQANELFGKLPDSMGQV